MTRVGAIPALCYDVSRIMEGLGMEPSDEVRRLAEAHRDGIE